MIPLHNFESPPDVPAEARLADELVKQARKLRWIGLEAEAEALFVEAQRFHGVSRPLSGPCNTDRA